MPCQKPHGSIFCVNCVNQLSSGEVRARVPIPHPVAIPTGANISKSAIRCDHRKKMNKRSVGGMKGYETRYANFSQPMQSLLSSQMALNTYPCIALSSHPGASSFDHHPIPTMPGPSHRTRRLAWRYSRGATWIDWKPCCHMNNGCKNMFLIS